MVTTTHCTMPDAQRGQKPRTRERTAWKQVCDDSSIEQMERMRDHHQWKLDHPHKLAGERARIENTIAVQEISAAIERRKAEGPQLRALPCLYQPRRGTFDRVKEFGRPTRPYDGLREFLRADMRAQIRLVK